MTAKQQSELDRAIEIAREKGHKVFTATHRQSGATVYTVRSASDPNLFHVLYIQAGRIHCDCKCSQQGRICSHSAAVRLFLIAQRDALASIEAQEAPAPSSCAAVEEQISQYNAQQEAPADEQGFDTCACGVDCDPATGRCSNCAAADEMAAYYIREQDQAAKKAEHERWGCNIGAHASDCHQPNCTCFCHGSSKEEMLQQADKAWSEIQPLMTIETFYCDDADCGAIVANPGYCDKCEAERDAFDRERADAMELLDRETPDDEWEEEPTIEQRREAALQRIEREESIVESVSQRQHEAAVAREEARKAVLDEAERAEKERREQAPLADTSFHGDIFKPEGARARVVEAW